MISNVVYKQLLIEFKEFYKERMTGERKYDNANLNFLCYHLADFVAHNKSNLDIFDFAKKLHDKIFDDINANGRSAVVLDGWVDVNVPYKNETMLSHQTQGRMVYLQQLIDKCGS